MAAKRVRDILDRVRGFHRRLRRLYEDLSEDEADPRVQVLLDYMGRHEEAFEEGLAQYEADAERGVLETWVQFANDETLQRVFREVTLHSGMSPDEVIACALTLDDALLQLYRDLAESTSVPRVQQLFASLAELEENREHQHARSLLE